MVTSVEAVSQEQVWRFCILPATHRINNNNNKKRRNATGIKCFSLIRSTLMNRQPVHLVDTGCGHVRCVKY